MQANYTANSIHPFRFGYLRLSQTRRLLREDFGERCEGLADVAPRSANGAGAAAMGMEVLIEEDDEIAARPTSGW